MAITVVQSAMNAGSSGSTFPEDEHVTLSTPASGNLLIGFISARNGSILLSSRGALTFLGGNTTGGTSGVVNYQLSAGTETTFIVGAKNSTTGGDYSCVGMELSGQAASAYINASSFNSPAASNPYATPSITPTVNNCLIVAWWGLSTTTAVPTATYNNGFAQLRLASVLDLGYCAVATLQQGTAAAVACSLTRTDAGNQITGQAGIIAIAPAPASQIPYQDYQRMAILAQ